MLKLKFKTGGSAFCDPYTGNEDIYCESAESARILRRIADELDAGYRDGSIIDINGNKIGEWSID